MIARPDTPRRLLVTSDLMAYGALGEADTGFVQQQLVAVLAEVYRAVGVPFDPSTDRWTGPTPSQPLGDATFDLLPPGVPEARTVNRLVQELAAVLGLANTRLSERLRLRMRTAVGQGTAGIGPNGLAGAAVAPLVRIRDCPAARAALERVPEADVVVLLTPDILASSVDTGHGLTTAQGVLVTAPVKPADVSGPLTAWLHVPGHRPPDVDRSPAVPPATPPPATPPAAPPPVPGGLILPDDGLPPRRGPF